ncbi:Phosphotyrosyl phosphatase activator [Cristinia sonorae]|uniref:Serine/threonine-protein phosphatase 2A activator n=1 Tax=Cristinia sonorae TaxID=1940300 RepID=A0A8K0XMS9_9AGAR|nr:Phosphotyrosyl phosphatase activator [Cristinia sonorae]
MAENTLLRQVSIAELPVLPLPSLKIKTEEDVLNWRDTQGYRDYGLFLRRLNESVVGQVLPRVNQTPSTATTSTLQLLDKLDRWIDEIPPLPTPQRFGNLAFRTWGKRLEDEAASLLDDLLGPEFSPAIPHLTPYFLTSFGSFTRMDYGTGHETSFALFLLCATLIRFFEPTLEQERDIVLVLFVRYLYLCWRLQDVYRLEPAGSHGVWGLDDYSFLGYIFGSAQLRDSDVPVSAVLHPPLPPTNLYFMSVSRIREVKTGPFHEHSSQLHSIACGVPRWAKVNSGLFKMYEAEVLGKRVVVQHIPLGGLLEWNTSSSDIESPSPPSQTANTPAPWASTGTPATVRTSIPGHGSHAFAPGATRLGATAAPWTAPGSLRNAGPLVPPQMPVGVLANTTLRPTRHVHPGSAPNHPQ